jgi:hypothetical protein
VEISRNTEDAASARDRVEEEGGEKEKDPFRGLLIKLPLHRKTVATASNDEELEYKIHQLRHLSTFELVRENNIARNKEELKRLGLDKSFNEAMGLTKQGGKCKAKGGGGRKAKHGRSEAEEGNESEEEDDVNEDDEEENNALAAPCIAWPQRAKPGAQHPAPKEWIKKARPLLQQQDLGKAWEELVVQWYTCEEKKGFILPVRFPPCRVQTGRLRALSITGEGPLSEEVSIARLLGPESPKWNTGDQGHRDIREGVASVVAGYQSRMV